MKNVVRQFLCVTMLVWIPGPVMSEGTRSEFREIDSTRTKESRTSEDSYKRDAARWGLSVEEWKRYLEIKRGPRGVWSPNVDPLAMLALEADNEADMRHYATLYAHMQDLRIQRELKVDRFRREAVQKLYAGKSTFDQTLLNVNKKAKTKTFEQNYEMSPMASPTDSLMFGDRLLYFASVNIKPAALVQRLTAKVEETAGVKLDIYVVGSDSDKDIMNWASSVGINAMLVKQKTITLNHDKGTLKKLSTDNAESQVFLQRGGVMYRVRESVL